MEGGRERREGERERKRERERRKGETRRERENDLYRHISKFVLIYVRFLCFMFLETSVILRNLSFKYTGYVRSDY